MSRRVRYAAAALLVLVATPALAQEPAPTPGEMVQRVGIDQKLGARLPADLELVDERGAPVLLGEFLGTRPVILSLVYYECPMLCGVAMEGLTRNLKVLGLQLGVDYDVVTVSIDENESPAVAAAAEQRYLDDLGDTSDTARAGWHALTASEGSISRLAETVGFRYVYLPEADEYAHATAVMVVTPDGQVSRYYYGVEYPARDLRLGLVEAAGGGIGSLTDQLLLLCYHYDPVTGKYGFAIWSALRAGAVATVLFIALFIVISLRRERDVPRGAVAVAGGSHERH